MSVCDFVNGALQKQPSESREFENTVICLFVFMSVFILAFGFCHAVLCCAF